MEKTNEKEVISLFRTGNFTIIYWDSGVPSVYKGHWDKRKEYDKDEYETMNKSEIDIANFDDGYCPEIVRLLTRALDGKSDSI